jgi:hypothetical protein
MPPSTTSLPSFKTATETLRYIEERAEKAILHELHVLMQSVLDMRSQLLLGDRAHADRLLLKLDGLHMKHTSTATPDENPSRGHNPATLETAHQVLLFDLQHGGVIKTFQAEGFMQALQLFQEQVCTTVDCNIQASWCNGHPVRGELIARTMEGTLVAHIRPADSTSTAHQADGVDVGSAYNAHASHSPSPSELVWPQLQAA